MNLLLRSPACGVAVGRETMLCLWGGGLASNGDSSRAGLARRKYVRGGMLMVVGARLGLVERISVSSDAVEGRWRDAGWVNWLSCLSRSIHPPPTTTTNQSPRLPPSAPVAGALYAAKSRRVCLLPPPTLPTLRPKRYRIRKWVLWRS